MNFWLKQQLPICPLFVVRSTCGGRPAAPSPPCHSRITSNSKRKGQLLGLLVNCACRRRWFLRIITFSSQRPQHQPTNRDLSGATYLSQQACNGPLHHQINIFPLFTIDVGEIGFTPYLLKMVKFYENYFSYEYVPLTLGNSCPLSPMY